MCTGLPRELVWPIGGGVPAPEGGRLARLNFDTDKASAVQAFIEGS